jgi:chromosome segregation ATPase
MFNHPLPPDVNVTTTAALLEILRMFSNPAAVEDRIGRLAVERDRLIEAAEKLHDLETTAAALKTEREAFATECAAERDRLQAAQDVLNQQRAAHDANVSRHEFETKKLERDRAELEAARRQHAAKLDELDRFKKAALG